MSSKPKDHTKTIATMKTVIADLKKNVNKITKEKEKADAEKEQQVSPEEHKAALDHFASQYKMAKVNKDEAAASEHAKAYHAYAAKLNAHYHSKLKEDVEQVDEISKELANRYMHSAFSDRKRTDDKMFTLRDRQDTLGHNNRNKITKLLKKSDKRTTGISRALQRITKEEIEICNQCKVDPCICDDSHGFVNEDWVQTGKTATHTATGKKTFEWAKVNKEGKRTGERHYRTADGKILGEDMNPYKIQEGKMGEKAAGDLDFHPEIKNDDPPFDKPYKRTAKTVVDKSGAKHTPLSRVRDLARRSLKKEGYVPDHSGQLNKSDASTMSKVAALLAKEKAAKAAKKPVKEDIELDEAVKVEKKNYSWGKMITVHHGSDTSFPLHPEHQKAIKKLRPGMKTTFKDETGRQVHAHREGDNVHLTHHNTGSSTATKTTVGYHHFDESADPSIINEISKQTLQSYKEKAKAHANKLAADFEAGDRSVKRATDIRKRDRGVLQAGHKIMKKDAAERTAAHAKANAGPKKPPESAEQKWKKENPYKPYWGE